MGKARANKPSDSYKIGEFVYVSFKKFPADFVVAGKISAIGVSRRHGKYFEVEVIERFVVNPEDISPRSLFGFVTIEVVH